MSRNEGFTTADISTAILADPKVGRLWRQVEQDEALMTQAVLIYETTVQACWAAGSRVTADEAAPWWMASRTADAIEALVQVRLLGPDHRIPPPTWDAWFTPAMNRRNALRNGGRLGADRRWGRESEPENMASPSPGQRPPTGQPNGRPMATRTDGREGGRNPSPLGPSVTPLASQRPGYGQAIDPAPPLEVLKGPVPPGKGVVKDPATGLFVAKPNGAAEPPKPAPKPRPQVDSPVDKPVEDMPF